MRTLLLSIVTTVTVLPSFNSHGQGTIQFANIFGTTTARTFLALIYGPDLEDPSLELHGAPPPGGNTIYTGGVLNTAGYSLGLFKGETMIVSAPIRTSATGALPAGTIAVITATVPDALPGTTAQLSVRAWQTAAGSFAAAKNSSSFEWGQSEVFTTGRLGGIDPTDGRIVTAPNSVGWTSFNVHVPEPSTIALGVLGLGSLLFYRRKQA